MSASSASALEQVARPLLELMQQITGLETTFITQIDWEAQDQEVMFALNSSDLMVGEGTSTDWSESMCRSVFLSGREQTGDVKGDFPGSLGGDRLGMQTFFAVPILAGERAIGTVCGASRRVVEIDTHALGMMRLVARALAAQLETEQERNAHRDRADRAEILALTDELTGLPNRRAFTARWEEELASSGRHGYPIALLLLDVDDFKAVNDQFGHDIGDRVLQAVGNAMRAESRTEDIMARLGGDEFALAVSYADADGTSSLAERLRARFIELGSALGVRATLSIGISTSTSTPRRSLKAAADRALYGAKNHGRDQIEVWDGPLGDLDVMPQAGG